MSDEWDLGIGAWKLRLVCSVQSHDRKGVMAIFIRFSRYYSDRQSLPFTKK